MAPDRLEDAVKVDATARTGASAPETGLGTRRTLVRGAGGLSLAACGLYLPALADEAAAKPVDDVQHRVAKRRQRRRHRLTLRRHHARQDRNDHQRDDPNDLLDGFDLYLHNETGDVGLHVECGFTYDGCKLNAVFNMGTTHHNQEQFLTDEASIYVWWANRFWIEFVNTFFVPVWFEVAEGGSVRKSCYPGGDVVAKYDTKVNTSYRVELRDRYYLDLRRDPDFQPYRKPQSAKTFQVWFRRHPAP